MKSIWTGAIGFGLVNIPVKMYSATQASELDLDMLDGNDHSNIRYLTVNEKTGKEVERKNIVKGYKHGDDYVILDKADFESAAAEKTKVIEITDFVDEREIDTIFFETPYYLEPDKSGGRAYALLREALTETGKAGIAIFVMRNKQILAILRADGDVIILNRIRFPEEIRDPSELNLPKKATVKAGELKMAISLIEQLTDKFDVSKYHDTYTEELLKVIHAKAKGKPVTQPNLKVAYSKTEDLMEQLKASLTKRKKTS